MKENKVNNYKEDQNNVFEESLILNVDIFSSEYEDEEKEGVVNEEEHVKDDTRISQKVKAETVNQEHMLPFEDKELILNIDDLFKESDINKHLFIIDHPIPKKKSNDKKADHFKNIKNKNSKLLATQISLANKERKKTKRSNESVLLDPKINVDCVSNFTMKIDINEGLQFNPTEKSLMNSDDNIINTQTKMFINSLKIEGV
ncbi:MAG TPA: hypothetical protein VK121_08460 [Pseudogracilibacillus sp.]|nr:hypothetical protein [Pseudogracilibacillus sp.]